MIRRLLAAAGAAALVAVAAGCAQTVHLEPAAHANSAECADVSVRLPDALGDLPRVWTDAQATAAWGSDDSTVLFTCGLDAPPPSTLQCVTVSGVDWIIDQTDVPYLRMTTYGREPAAEVYVDTSAVRGDDVLNALATAVVQLPRESECVAPDEAEQVDGDVPVTGPQD